MPGPPVVPIVFLDQFSVYSGIGDAERKLFCNDSAGRNKQEAPRHEKYQHGNQRKDQFFHATILVGVIFQSGSKYKEDWGGKRDQRRGEKGVGGG